MNAMGAVTLVIDRCSTARDRETMCLLCCTKTSQNQSIPLTSSCSVIATQNKRECIRTCCCFCIADWFRSFPTSFVPPKSRAGSDRPETVRVSEMNQFELFHHVMPTHGLENARGCPLLLRVAGHCEIAFSMCIL